MKLLVAVLFLAAASQASPAYNHAHPPVVQANGFLADTAEVAAEKARFNYEYNQALRSTRNAEAPFGNQFGAPIQNNYQSDFAPPGSALSDDGTLVPTFDVSKATAEHYREIALSRGLDTSTYDSYLSNLATWPRQ